ncbi:MAG: pilin [Candidatus Paceibacterota bacterium]
MKTFLLTLALLTAVALPFATHAQIFDPDFCDPAVLPGEPNACDLGRATDFIDRIIQWVIRLALPLSAVFIAYGGFLILTSSGNTGRIESGKKVITSVVIGLIIILTSFLIVKAVFTILPVNESDTPQDLRTS